MVNLKTDDLLTRTFNALADPTRRAILAALAEHDELTVGALARPFPISLPAVMKHLKVLDAAGLVVREKRGRAVHCRLDPEPLDEARAWIRRHERFWSARLDRLDEYLEEHP